MKTRIEASRVTIRQMSGRKCHKVFCGDCRIIRDQITPQMVDIPEIVENGFITPMTSVEAWLQNTYIAKTRAYFIH